MPKSKKLKNWSIILTGSLVAVALSLCLFTHSARASGGGTLIARSQLRRVVDPSPRTAFGSVLAQIDTNGKETFQVNVSRLGTENFGPIIRGEPSYTTNIVSGLYIAPLNRINVKNGSWTRSYVGIGQAPDDILPVFGNLSQLDSNELAVAQPGTPRFTTIFTNIIAGVTNISFGVTNVVGTVTNIIDGIVIPNPGQTNFFFEALWAPLYSLSSDPSALSYHRKGKLVAVGDASPKAVGTVSISFDGNTGRSVLKISAKNLTPGQQYTLFVANDTNHVQTVMLPVDFMVQKNLGSTATFVRDTQFGDPLPKLGQVPVQARDIGDLSGNIIQIRDAFDTIHLQGDMP
jgi:hypothetical protein